MKRRLMHIAHEIKSNYSNFAEALKAAWRIIKLRLSLKSGVVAFSFKKVDGSIRKAIGTLKNTPATLGVKATNYAVFTYFDVEANGWRSAKLSNLIF